jgi:hypothetical protein
MTQECKRCARAAQLFICSACTENLRRQLRDLPWWLERLVEASLGQVAMSDGGRRTRRRSVLHGDDTLASHIEPFPDENEADLKKARKQRQRAALSHALAAGRVNVRASNEYQRIHNTLTHWVKDLCESRGLGLPHLTHASDMARWMATNAHSIASQDDAAQCCEDIAHITKTIERIVNRPEPPRFIGPCPSDAPEAVLTKRIEQGDKTIRCNFQLTASHKATSVVCPQCSTGHEVKEVIAQNFAEMGDKLMTVRDLVDWVLPKLEEHIPQSTLEAWIRRGWLEVRGFSDQGHQMVRLDDVRKVRAERPRVKRAG